MLRGMRAAYHPNPMDAKPIGEITAKYKGSMLLTTPTFAMTYVRKCTKEEFASQRFVIVGAEKLRESVAAAFLEKFGLPMLEGYGCTEMSPVVAVNRPDFEEDPDNKQQGAKPGTVGHPIPGLAVRIVDPESFEPLAPGKEGLMLVNGPSRMIGYLNDEARTAAAMRDGWYITGDIGCVDEDGFVRITDRLARFSKIGGEMVPHLKIEEALAAICDGAPTLVVGVPDEARGERLIAIYTKTDATPMDLWKKLGETDLPKLWIPKRDSFLQVEALPTLGTGKTDLRAAKALAREFATRA